MKNPSARRGFVLAFSFVFSLLSGISLTAQTVTISGRVSEVNTTSPLVGATVLLVGQDSLDTYGTTTGPRGEYQLQTEQPGRYRLEVSYLGYVPRRESVLLGSGPATNRDFTLIHDPDLTLNVVEVTFPAADVTVNPLQRSVRLEAVRRLPATFYDPARLLALTPGVVQTNDQANHLSVRGNSPNRNLWRLNGLAIVNPNHTANAGTQNDLPTLSGGGVNALSAQLLDNSTFYAGGLPASYGNATGGTFDMRLRPGNTQRAQHQLQAGFIGFDVATEGPFSPGRENSGSYLFNYRYSFTGLLADLGADFGGEEIRFQDFSGHIYQPVGERGELSVFGLWGASSNRFDGNLSEPETNKDFFDIDFVSRLGIGGFTYDLATNSGKFEIGAAWSGVNHEREQRLAMEETVIEDFTLTQERITARAQYVWGGSDYFSLAIGAEWLREENEFQFFDLPESTIDLAAPFAEYRNRFEKFGLRAGLRYSLYYARGRDAAMLLEPRLQFSYFGNRSVWSLTAERTSNVPTTNMIQSPFIGIADDWISANHQLDLSYQLAVGKRDRLTTSLYYQFTPDESGILATLDFSGESFGFVTANDLVGLEGFFIERAYNVRSYGLELSYQRPIERDRPYFNLNLALFRSQFQTPENFLLAEKEWRSGRFDRNFIFQGIVGKEWSGNNRKGKVRAYGINAALTAAGGERFLPIYLGTNAPEPQFDPGRNDRLPAFIRPDLRLYRRKHHRKVTTTLALDIQNLIGRTNVAFRFYDPFLDRVEDQEQLSFIPVLSYRLEWR